MTRRGLLTLAVLWTTGCGAAFVYFFSRADTDDFAGFIPAMFALQLPGFLALAGAPHGARLSVGRAIAIAIPGAFVGAFVALLAGVVVGERLIPPDHNELFDLRPLLLGLVVGVIGLIGTGLFLGFYLAKTLHPRGGLRAFAAVAIASLIGSLIVLGLEWHGELALVMACTVAWPVPLLLACVPRRAPPAPIARVV